MARFKVSQIINWAEAQVANPEMDHVTALLSSLEVTGASTLKDASENEVTFFFSKHYQNDLIQTRSKIIITGDDIARVLKANHLPQWKTSIILKTAYPYGAMAKVTKELSKTLSPHDHQVRSEQTKVHPTAVIHPTVKLGASVQIGANVVIEEHSVIGDGVVLYAGTYVGSECEIGADTVLFPRVTLYARTRIGARCRIHAGAVLGADGFGYAPLINESTKLKTGHLKIYHLGRVFVQDDVEIGANTTIDRGTVGDTIIEALAKIDNQVQIGHNCRVGEGAVICGCSGMAGSSRVGKFSIVGAMSGLANQVSLGDYASLAGMSGLTKSSQPNEELAGVPARPASEHFRILAAQQKHLRKAKKD